MAYLRRLIQIPGPTLSSNIAFFFDIDGTLTDNRTHKIVPSAEKTLHALEKNGHFVAIATGRAHYKAVSFTNAIDIHNLVCAGGGCIARNDKIMYMHALPHDKAVSLLKEADRRNAGWLVMLDDSDTVVMKDYRFLEQAGRRMELTSYIYQPDFSYEACDHIYKIYLALSSQQEGGWISTLGHLRMTQDYLVFQYDEKKKGIEEMMDLLHAPRKDVVVFGDDTNDLVMFDPGWFSIAMGNGNEKLKEKADYVTAANIDDGIEKACRHFGWID